MKKLIGRGLRLTLCAILLTIVIAGVYVASIKTVPLDKALLENAHQTAVYYDDGNKPIENTTRGKNASYVEISELPEYVSNAFVAIEDKRFFEHDGLDYKRIVGAAIENLKSGSYAQGGSTITQQLAKNTHLSAQKSIERKLSEAKLAVEIEENYSKQDILELYLNIVYFGNSVYGIQSASRFYFGKNACELTIGESATLAAIINSPARYSLTTNPAAVQSRKNLVLKSMLSQNKLTSAEYEEAFQEKIILSLDNTELTASCYLNAVASETEEILRSINVRSLGGCKIFTYFNPELQTALINSYEEMPKVQNATTMSVIIDNKAHGISAVYANPYILINSKRQPGSALKPLAVYAPALESGIITPDTVYYDEPIKLDDYEPKNYNGKYMGSMTARTALATSNNIVAIKIFDKLGAESSKAFLKSIGISTVDSDVGHSIALGGMTHGVSLIELTRGYSALANGGQFTSCGFVKQIIDKNGNLLYNHAPRFERCMSEKTSSQVLEMMQSSRTIGTAQRLKKYPFDVSVKTGTVGIKQSKKNTDAYCMSVTDAYSLGVWIGAERSAPLEQFISGGTYPTALTEKILDRLYPVPPKNMFVIHKSQNH